MSTRLISSDRELFPGASLTVNGKPKPGFWLLIGPPKVGKNLFCKRFICDRLLEGTPCIYILTNQYPGDFISEILSENPSLENTLEENLQIVDCYSWRIGKRGKLSLSDPANLNELSMLIQKAEEEIRKKNGYAVTLHSISTLALEAGPAATVKFLQILTGRLKRNGGFGPFTLEEGIHHESFVNTLRFIFDGILEMRFKEEIGKIKRMFRVFSLPKVNFNTEWIEISEMRLY